MKLFEQIPLATKLFIGFGFSLIITIVIGVNAINNISIMSEKVETIYEKDLLGISHLKEANVNLVFIGRAMRQMMLDSNAEKREKSRAMIEKSMKQFDIEIAEAEKRTFRAENKVILAKLIETVAVYKANVNKAIALTQQEDYLQSTAAAYISTSDFMEVINSANELISDVARNKEKGADATADELKALSEKSRQFSLILMLFGVFFGGIVSFLALFGF